MAHRPVLKIGDVVRLSKVGRKAYGSMYGIKNRTMIVAGFVGDSSEGHTIISCNIPETDSSRGAKSHIKRRHLWSTGYNVNKNNVSKASSISLDDLRGMPVATKSKNNNSKTCVCPIEKLMNFGCKCGGE
jgi:hypothetical protein